MKRRPASAPATPLRTRMLEIDGRLIRVAESGAPAGRRTLLLFNGIGASVETMVPFMARFEDTRVLTFDVPGVGASPAPALPYRMHQVARLGAGLLDHLGIEQADVLGVSWGGAVAQEFALQHPERCRTLTLAATCAGFVMVPGKPDVMVRLLSPRRYLDPAYMMRVGGKLYGGVLRFEQDLLEMHADAMRGPSLRGYFYQLMAVWGWTSWHRLGQLRAPALLLMGSDDPIVPPVNGRLLAMRIKSAELETVDCGHLFVLTRPLETAQRVERFLAAH